MDLPLGEQRVDDAAAVVDSDTASGLNNVAMLLQDQGELAAARPLYESGPAHQGEGAGARRPEDRRLLSGIGASPSQRVAEHRLFHNSRQRGPKAFAR